MTTSILHTPRLIIAGPCSAETREQIFLTGKQLAATGRVHLFRAGVWKPRTRPGSFEGVGQSALPWLHDLRQETGLPLAIEVASAAQVEQALEAKIDVLWIGARTTANPFSVQEVANALRGTAIPVIIKNPTNADVDLWTGSVERIMKAGITEMALVHRGFSHYGSKVYRNEPMWQLPLEMRRRFATLPMLCDPSHICGNRSLLHSVAQKAADLGYNGLMIESHHAPQEAWSDAQQQIAPEQLVQLLDSLVWRSQNPDLQDISALESLRGQIDAIDDELLELLSKRMALADEIGSYKKENNITILQIERWNYILARAKQKMLALGLDERFITAYFDAIHMESIRHQTRIMNA